MTREPPILDMLPDGTFREPARPPGVPLQAKLILGAVLVTAVAGSIAVAALAIWVVSMVLPVLILAAAAAYGLYRFQRWQLRRGQPLDARPNARPWQSRGFGQ